MTMPVADSRTRTAAALREGSRLRSLLLRAGYERDLRAQKPTVFQPLLEAIEKQVFHPRPPLSRKPLRFGVCCGMRRKEQVMTGVAFGMFDWIDRAAEPLHQLYEERLQLLEVADSAGFFCYHLAEHHATPLGMAPSPALFLAAAAQRTRRIRLGPLVYLLPLHNPLRLIEEVSMLDQLSGGRLELGVGRGVVPYELRYHGVDPDDTRAIFNEALAVLVAGLTNSRLTFEGQYYRYNDVPMELQPLQRPYPPLWYPTHNPESVQYAARHGYNFVGLGPAAAVRQHVDLYRQTWAAHRHEPDRLNGHVEAPKVGVLRQVVVAKTDDEALAAAHTAHSDWYRSITKLWHDHDDHSVDGLFAWEPSTQHETMLSGSPSRVREQMERLVETSGCNYVVCALAWGTMPHEQRLHSLRLFAEEVMPAFSGSVQ
jgi:alkanesulfonate monooxygenase SsuD/methylene tetrahydromethanopterin reductase-like flavin-dependent oxidoreductase (luciferase family)